MTELTLEKLPEAVNQLFNKLESIESLLLDKSGDQSEVDQLLTVSQVASFLDLSIPTIYGYVSRAEIPVCKRKHTKRLYFSKQDITNWIKKGRRKTISEIESEADNQLSKN